MTASYKIETSSDNLLGIDRATIHTVGASGERKRQDDEIAVTIEECDGSFESVSLHVFLSKKQAIDFAEKILKLTETLQTAKP